MDTKQARIILHRWSNNGHTAQLYTDCVMLRGTLEEMHGGYWGIQSENGDACFHACQVLGIEEPTATEPLKIQIRDRR